MSIEPEAAAGAFAYSRLRPQFETIVSLGDRLRGDAKVDDVHDMRVAIRRLRALLKLFEDDLPAELVDLERRFGNAASRLGDVRDIDVQIERLEKWSVDGLIPRLRGDREIAADAMRRYLGSFAYRQLVVTAKTLLAKEATRGARTLGEVLPGTLRKCHRKFLRRAEKLQPNDDAKRFHKARIAGKKLRYTLEVASDVFEAAKPYVKRLVKIQDILGEHQDCFVACEFFRSQAAAWSLPEQEAARELVDRYEARARKLREKFPSVFEKAEDEGWAALEARF